MCHPQIELHVHLDGAIRLQTILDVAKWVRLPLIWLQILCV